MNIDQGDIFTNNCACIISPHLEAEENSEEKTFIMKNGMNN